ncbi:hypothetical protein B0T16DRAFT_112574 [Cercophora newfieldiana]|uniref:Uncharacterized protein n=1 Tax=Cercophora newfieldiana TaxID=92897 RepID=A0AA39YAU3_9PEZI|nr:hypothetical protein B0T16DRAFT_112574 [Cercophora newfieldiana]
MSGFEPSPQSATLVWSGPENGLQAVGPTSVSNTLPLPKPCNYDSVYQCCIPARDSLLAMANKYRRKLKLPPLDVATGHSWVEVEAELQLACSAVEVVANRDKQFSGSVGKVRQAFRSFCQHAGAGQTFVSLVPSDAFGFSSILCGGLKVIFTGLHQTSLYREEVYRTLEDLPYILTDHSVPLNTSLCGSDEELHKRTALLYVAVFNLLEHLLGWFVKSTAVTRVKIFVDPAGFSEKLKEKTAEVRLRAQRWERRALRLSIKRQDDAMQLQCWSASALKTILDRTEDLEDRALRSTVLERLDSILNAVVDAFGNEPTRAKLPNQRQRALPGTDSQEAEEILRRFLFEPNLVSGDCTAISKTASRDSPGRKQLNGTRVTSLQSNSRVRAWLTMDESSLLLVNGRSKPHPRSETSTVCARVVQRLAGLNQPPPAPGKDSSVIVVPLAFFCGQHRDWQRDPNGNPAELAMSLLLQLVDRHGASIPADLMKRCRAQTKPMDIASICSSLEAIISSLSRKVIVVLIVDGIKFFTHPPERRDQMRELVERLVAIYRTPMAATLKFLFTSPTRSEFIEDLFQDGEILSLARDLSWSAVDRGRGRLPLVLPADASDEETTEEGSEECDEELDEIEESDSS